MDGQLGLERVSVVNDEIKSRKKKKKKRRQNFKISNKKKKKNRLNQLFVSLASSSSHWPPPPSCSPTPSPSPSPCWRLFLARAAWSVPPLTTHEALVWLHDRVRERDSALRKAWLSSSSSSSRSSAAAAPRCCRRLFIAPLVAELLRTRAWASRRGELNSAITFCVLPLHAQRLIPGVLLGFGIDSLDLVDVEALLNGYLRGIKHTDEFVLQSLEELRLILKQRQSNSDVVSLVHISAISSSATPSSSIPISSTSSSGLRVKAEAYETIELDSDSDDDEQDSKILSARKLQTPSFSSPLPQSRKRKPITPIFIDESEYEILQQTRRRLRQEMSSSETSPKQDKNNSSSPDESNLPVLESEDDSMASKLDHVLEKFRESFENLLASRTLATEASFRSEMINQLLSLCQVYSLPNEKIDAAISWSLFKDEDLLALVECMTHGDEQDNPNPDSPKESTTETSHSMSHTAAVYIITKSFSGRFLVETVPSRLLIATMTHLAQHRPLWLIDGCLIPTLKINCSDLKLTEVMAILIKEHLSVHWVKDFMRKLLSPPSPIPCDLIFAVLQSGFQSAKLLQDEDCMRLLISFMTGAIKANSVKGSSKFSSFLLQIINSKNKVVQEQRLALQECVGEISGIMKRSLLSALEKLSRSAA